MAEHKKADFQWRADDEEGRAIDQAMIERCSEQGHQWENACSITLRVYQICRWCGEQRR